MIVRECLASDLALLEIHLPSPGRSRWHEPRFSRQLAGRSTYLTVWLSPSAPVAVGEIMWTGCVAPEVVARFPSCPELSGLTVVPARQSRGIGSFLIREAESRALSRGCATLGMGVAADNVRAAALYLRLGYRDVGCTYLDRYDYVTDVRHEVADPCRFLVKEL
jgi:ribosomal protein S18 acetylase RimI-like enzyme